MPKKKTIKTNKKEKVVELLMKEAPTMFEKMPRGSLVRSRVEEVAEEIVKVSK